MLRGSLHLRSAALVSERPVDYDLMYSPRRQPGSTKADDLSSTKDRRLARLSMKKVQRRWQGKGELQVISSVFYDQNDNMKKIGLLALLGYCCCCWLCVHFSLLAQEQILSICVSYERFC